MNKMKKFSERIMILERIKCKNIILKKKQKKILKLQRKLTKEKSELMMLSKEISDSFEEYNDLKI